MKNKKSIGAQLLSAPYFVWAAIFIIVPLIIVIYYTFTDKNGAFTLANIISLKDYGHNFYISILYSLIATVITLIIAYPFAYFLAKRSPLSQRIQYMLVMLPMWINLLIRTYSMMNIMEKTGVINQALGLLGLGPVTMIGTSGAVITGMVYNYLPYMILPIYSILQKMDGSLLEAAGDLGCNGFEAWRRVTLPLSMPGVVSGIMMVFVPSVSTFYISQKLGGGTIMLIGDTIERQIQLQYNYNLGAAMSFVLMILILASMMIMNHFTDDVDGGGLVA